jgi:hypothetical protein
MRNEQIREKEKQCSNFTTATTPDDGRQAETCSVRQSVM